MDAVHSEDADFMVHFVGHVHGLVGPEGDVVDSAELVGGAGLAQGLRADRGDLCELPLGRRTRVGDADDAVDGVDGCDEVAGRGRGVRCASRSPVWPREGAAGQDGSL